MQVANGPPPVDITVTSCSGTWRGPASPAQLRARFVQHPVSVHAPRGELPAVGVQRELPVEAEPLAALDVRARLALTADPEGLEPHQREEREAVVELGEVEVARPELGAAPQLARRVR